MKHLWRLALLALAVTGSALAADKAPRSGDGMDLNTLAGEHAVRGRNPDGSAYEGKVRMRIKGPLVLVEWTIKDQVSYGTGLVEGLTLGVALENGVAIYQIVPQAEGKSLIGLWAGEGAEKASEETIFIGDTDVDEAQFAVEEINGVYRATNEAAQGIPSTVTISGGPTVKAISLKSGGNSAAAEGLALGEGLAVITPDGFTVFQVLPGKKGLSLLGHSVDRVGQISLVSLEPVK